MGTVSLIKSKIQDLDSEVQFMISKARMIKAERERAKQKADEEAKKEETKEESESTDEEKTDKKEDEKPEKKEEEKPKEKKKKKSKIPDEGIFTEKELTALEKKIAEVERWRDEKVAEQEAQPSSQMPTLTVSLIKSKIQDLESEVQFMISKARMIKAERERAKRKAEEEKKKEEEKAKKEKKEKKKKKTLPRILQSEMKKKLQVIHLIRNLRTMLKRPTLHKQKRSQVILKTRKASPSIQSCDKNLGDLINIVCHPAHKLGSLNVSVGYVVFTPISQRSFSTLLLLL